MIQGRGVLRGLMRRMGAAPAVFAVGAALMLFSVGACGDPAAPENAPRDHTVFHGGFGHAPGASNAATNCVTCHGADLRGGDSGEPSCFSCHGQKWGQA